MKRLEIIGIEGLGEVKRGDSVARIIIEGCSRLGLSLTADDILVVAHKIVSKAEGRMISLAEVKPSAKASELSRQLGKDASIIEVILKESRRIVRMGGGTIIVETHHGFICANAGVDLSNVAKSHFCLRTLIVRRERSESRFGSQLVLRQRSSSVTVLAVPGDWERWM